MTHQPRQCFHCGRTISWRTRVDARFCGPACRQAAYRRRRVTGLAPEVRREYLDPAELPKDISRRLADRDTEVLSVDYDAAVRCKRCGSLGFYAFFLIYSRLSSRPDGPYCNDCTIDVIHVR